ncbi:Guanylate-binding protein, N-terminal,P-loop containing nucleoside triphosphate hydrolase,Guanylate- [Cinara cedri]|uniref:Guanylate-binding protein, N-terminal,P-loop containing nucleoside triphosphate hydrolase,Guanylate n=1 Tax=Cinara cedri TaxID=506608 RepID=A0A5E4NE66_9HEMI|nr:Guanylate-binding protein, N-terminal,P-loop containing nucleoside triphosphate hydrolase,Guanylate- [Cinara cedri]
METVQNAVGHGKPIPIVLAEENHQFILDEAALEEILLKDEIKDRNVVVVSVAGAFRKGKSFLLDFFLRYMKATYHLNLIKEDTHWIGSDDKPLDGFSWRGGSERDTTGILMWSEVFKATLDNGEKVAIILLDTQGTFDSESTVKDCATVFALSTMLSSIQIYNLSQNIQEDDLQHLQLFTEYGRLALEDTGKKPFQKLQFLVRDWSFPYEADYGADGGQQILDRRLQISDKQHPELQSLRKHIKSCFSEISCYLMPHPGLKVATNPKFDGRLSEIETEFKQNLLTLIPMLLRPKNLILKEISGQKVKAKELVQYFKSYINLFTGDELPEPKSMLVATAEANNLSAVASAREVYHQMMEAACGGNKPYMNTNSLDEEHFKSKDKAMEQFIIKRKMGGDEFSESYKLKLETDIDEEYLQFKSHNESKNIFKSARTPAVFFAIAVLCYFISGLFHFFGLYSIASCVNLIMGIALLILILWAYIRYSGEHREIGEAIDDAANITWDNFMKPSYEIFLQKGIEQAANQAMNMAVNNSTSPISGVQSPFGKKPNMQRMNSLSEMNGRFKQS